MGRGNADNVTETVTVTITRSAPRGMQGLDSPKNPWNEPLPQDGRLKTFLLNVSASLVATVIWVAGGAAVGVVTGVLIKIL